MNVSVVIPAWNAEETISRTLESLLAQTYPAWEAVVVDDGSRDATASIVRDYAERDDRIRLVEADHGGEAAARNVGLEAVGHPWLLFLDSDDWIAPEYLTRMTTELRADPTLDAVHCGYARVAADGTRLIDPYEPPVGDMFPTWARRSAFPVHTCVVRRALVQEVGGFDPSLCKSADWDLWQRVARTGARFGAVREVLAFYQMRPFAASLEAAQMLRDGLTVLRRGHAPDPRVPRAHPDHALGAPPEEVRTQAWYLLCWCAGLLIGRDQDARPLIALCEVEQFPELHPPAVAQTLWNSAPLPLCEDTRIWELLWLRVHSRVDDFLVALETASGAAGLADRARASLLRSVLRCSPALSAVADELEAGEKKQEEMQGLIKWRNGRIHELEASLMGLEKRIREMETTLTGRDERTREMETSLTGRDERIREMETTLTGRDERIREMETTLTGRDERIREMETTLTGRDERIREMETTLTGRDERIREMETSLTGRDERIREMETSLTGRDERIREMETTLTGRDERIREMETSLTGRDERIREMEASLTGRDERIREMEERIAQMEGELTALAEHRDLLEAKRHALQNSPEHQAGDVLLNRLRLRRPVGWLSRRFRREDTD